VTIDICVPISALAACVGETHADIKRTGLLALSSDMWVTTISTSCLCSMLKTLRGFLDRLVDRALRMDGTCSGEHGVGQGKIRYLAQEHGAGVEVMIAIKKALDPLNILNPGKIFALP
jgi:D-lactate dehydrogenase (cytochrome)